MTCANAPLMFKRDGVLVGGDALDGHDVCKGGSHVGRLGGLTTVVGRE